MSLQHKGELSITELSSGEQALGNGQLPKTRSTLHQYPDGTVSALSRKVSFLVSEAVPCVHFNSRSPCLTLPPPDLS